MRGAVFRQLIGVPIGIDTGAQIANLTLWYYENKLIESAHKTKYTVIKLDFT